MNYRYIMHIFMLTIIHTSLSSMNAGQKLSLFSAKALPPTIHRLWNPSAQRLLYKLKDQAASALSNPFYENFIDPLYIGNKSKHWGQSLKDTFLKQTYDPSVLFMRDHYTPWKDKLTPLQKITWHKDIQNYEKAHNAYLKNPTNQKNQDNLLKEMSNIASLIKTSAKQVHQYYSPKSNPKNRYFQEHSFEMRHVAPDNIEKHFSDHVGF